MKTILKPLSYIGLALTVVPAFLVFYGVLSLADHKLLMLAGMLLWFVTAPFWILEKKVD
ncbi:hypothetical protein GCM10023189_30480 [Nibrella saemangeumensis]|uniref:Uncharacterized protein n=1 Tax=Nibrella saemangeumensis TaxID=1084526 RepID=A0ABP8MYP3_9BACT